MLGLPRFVRVSRARRLRGLALIAVAGAALQTGCAGYQLALQPTATPGPLGVRQIPPQQGAIDPGAAVAAMAQAAGASPAQVQTASSAPVPVPAQASAQPEPTGAAAALAAPPITARPPVSSSASSPAQAVPTVNGSVPVTPSASPSRPAATATPMPVFTTTPAATSTAGAAPRMPSATPTSTPAATATARPPATVLVSLPAGTSDFLYVGASMPVDRALAALAGNFDIVYFTPAGGGAQVAYRPGDPAPPLLSTNTLVRIGMKKPMSFSMTRPN